MSAIRSARRSSTAARPYAPPAADEPFRLLVFGGSQGARVFSELVPAALGALSRGEPLARLRIVQQARPEDVEATREAFAQLGIEAEVEPFFTDMGERLADAHLVICRAGASTVAELAVIGRPAILVPYPHALDHDQAENARALAEAGGAWLVPETRADADDARAPLARPAGDPRRSWPTRPSAAARRRPAWTRPSGWPISSEALRRNGRRFRPIRRVAARGPGDLRMKLPRDIGPIHFVGIGGIGMSGIAEVLANQNYRVRGSDVADSANVQRLRDRGIEVAIGHDAANLDDAAVVVVSSAIKRDNPELVEARARGLPVVRRAEMLAELMRLKSAIAIGGTHGKTTTTSIVAALLDAGGLDPTVINGGIINAYGTNARMGEGDWMVVEVRRVRRHLRQAPRRHRGRHQHRSGAPRPLRQLRRAARGVSRLRRERAVLRFCGDVPRPPGGAGAGRADRGPPHHHLWPQPAGRGALSRLSRSATARRISPSTGATA